MSTTPVPRRLTGWDWLHVVTDVLMAAAVSVTMWYYPPNWFDWIGGLSMILLMLEVYIRTHRQGPTTLDHLFIDVFGSFLAVIYVWGPFILKMYRLYHAKG